MGGIEELRAVKMEIKNSNRIEFRMKTKNRAKNVSTHWTYPGEIGEIIERKGVGGGGDQKQRLGIGCRALLIHRGRFRIFCVMFVSEGDAKSDGTLRMFGYLELLR